MSVASAFPGPQVSQPVEKCGSSWDCSCFSVDKTIPSTGWGPLGPQRGKSAPRWVDVFRESGMTRGSRAVVGWPQRERQSRDQGERLLTGSRSGRKHGLCARFQASKIVGDRDRLGARWPGSRIRSSRERHGDVHEITCEFTSEIVAAACSRHPKRVCVAACSQVGLPSHFASTAAIRIERWIQARCQPVGPRDPRDHDRKS